MKKNKKLFWLLAFAFCIAFTPVSVPGIGAQTVQALSNTGWKSSGGYWYYYQNGQKQTGFLKLGNTTYYLDSTGRMCTGLQKLSQGRYYFRADGSMVVSSWVKIKQYWYYFGKDGKALTSQFLKQDGKYYYVNQNGAMFTGLRTIDGKKYYFNSSGVMQTGWVEIGEAWYYFDTNGIMHKGWLHQGDETYFLLKSGKMAVGRIKNSKGQYYFFNTGNVKSNNSKLGELQKGWTQVGANWYHFNETTGIMSFGVLTSDGKKYYLNEVAGKREYGLKNINGKYYYFETGTGVMVTNAKKTIGGILYEFDEKGVGTASQDYIVSGDTVKVLENGKWYTMQKEYTTHPGVATGTLSDDDLLAALVDAEANDQGLAGMTAVAVTILNRTLPENTTFPTNLRYVIYAKGQYSPVFDGALLRRLNGVWEEKAMAYQAVTTAKKIISNYKSTKKPRVISGISTSVMGRNDFDCTFFMMKSSFAACNLNWDACQTFQYRDHVFFSKWVTN